MLLPFRASITALRRTFLSVMRFIDIKEQHRYIMRSCQTGDRNAGPVSAKDLDAAEVLFMTCGLTPEHAAALRGTVQRNKVASVDTTVDDEIAAKFRYAIPPR
jgi:hypothetical protein